MGQARKAHEFIAFVRFDTLSVPHGLQTESFHAYYSALGAMKWPHTAA